MSAGPVNREYSLSNDRRGRVFAAHAGDLDRPELEDEFAAQFIDDDDLERDGLLRTLLTDESQVDAFIHPLEDPSDVVKVFLRKRGTTGARLFACAIIDRSRLEQMLVEEAAVFESFTLQVADLKSAVTDRALATALNDWCRRVYPAIEPPRFWIRRWVDPDLTQKNSVNNSANMALRWRQNARASGIGAAELMKAGREVDANAARFERTG